MDNELILFDRIEVIKSTNQKYDLENNAYISFSGGKDSTILHYLIDMALPNNRIPRVFINTGIEYNYIVEFVKELASKDDRFIILKPSQAIKPMLEKVGYPFKSKLHSHLLSIYNNSGLTNAVKKYLGEIEGNIKFICPNILKYQFTKDFNIKCSEKCCTKLKKDPTKKWQKENNRSIVLTGMRKEEGGAREKLTCIITDKQNKLVKFHPLVVINDDFENWFIDKYNIELCKLYREPFNFKRTGCKGCPYSLDLQEQLDTMAMYLPSEKKQCEMIWKPVYEEYRRIGYRLRKDTGQMSIFDFIEKGEEK